MTEAEAWQYIARCWDKTTLVVSSYPEASAVTKSQECWGLCDSIESLDEDSDMKSEMMQALFIEYSIEGKGGYFWQCSKDGAVERAKAARHLALLAVHEEENSDG